MRDIQSSCLKDVLSKFLQLQSIWAVRMGHGNCSKYRKQNHKIFNISINICFILARHTYSFLVNQKVRLQMRWDVPLHKSNSFCLSSNHFSSQCNKIFFIRNVKQKKNKKKRRNEEEKSNLFKRKKYMLKQ